ncbi:type I-B CRISPR-associated protein Cas7/Cst2/DevR [Thermovibrio sp.]
MVKRALTLTFIFDAMSGNYGESVGNISELKKLTKHGQIYSYISRQAIRYEIWKFLKEQFRIDTTDYWDEEPELKEEVERILREADLPSELPPSQILEVNKEVVQFHPDVNALNCVEADLFGYMKTKKNKVSKTRPAVVRISPAVSLEPMAGDIEFGTNKSFADRKGENPNPFQFEHHSSLYTYTVTVNLDSLGKEENIGEVPREEKARRLKLLLRALFFLSREIKGRNENLAPLFVIGGIYSVKNPFFLERVLIEYKPEMRKYRLNTEIIADVCNLSFKGERVGNSSLVGYLKSFWDNDFEEELKEALKEGSVLSIPQLLQRLEKEVDRAFGVGNESS